jgi:hypothetical protein
MCRKGGRSAATFRVAERPNGSRLCCAAKIPATCNICRPTDCSGLSIVMRTTG